MPTKSQAAIFREACKAIAALLKVAEDLVGPKPKSTLDDFYGRFADLKDCRQKLDTVFYEILDSADLTSDQEQLYTQNHSKANDDYTRIMVIHHKLRAMPSASAQPSAPSSAQLPAKSWVPATCLPKIELPRFSSRVEDWPSFIAIFRSLTDDMATLTDAVKLHYLLSSLSGEALSMISHLKITDENYPIALDILSKRFDNRRVLIDRFVDIILGLPTIHARSEIRRSFLTPLVSALSNLENLNLPMNDSNYVFVSILIRKLKGDLRTLFERKYGSCRQLPTLKDLVPFLEEHARCVDNERSAPAPTQPSHFQQAAPTQPIRPRQIAYPTFRPVPQPTHSSHVRQSNPQALRPSYTSTPLPTPPRAVTPEPPRQRSSPTSNIYCPYCRSRDHRLIACPKFNNQPVQGRWDFIEARDRCCRCLGPHYETECKSTGACRHCGDSQHHTALHRQDDVPLAMRSAAHLLPPHLRAQPKQRPPSRPQHISAHAAQANPPSTSSSPTGSRSPDHKSQGGHRRAQ